MGRIRSVLLANANESLDRAARWYLRLFETHPVAMWVMSLASIPVGVVAFIALGVEGLEILAVAAAIVSVVMVAGVMLPYLVVRAAVRRLRRR